MHSIVATDPAYDDTTRYISYWLEQVEAAVGPKDVELHIIKGKDATPDKLKKLIKKVDPDLVFLNGHGQYDEIYGHNGMVLVSTRSRAMLKLLKNRLVHSLTCSSGNLLGPKAIKVGAKSFIGYREPFIFYHTTGQPLRVKDPDPIAELFLRPAHTAMVSLATNKTAGESFQSSQQLFATNLAQAMAGPQTNDTQLIAAALYHDMRYQVMLGDRNARVA